MARKIKFALEMANDVKVRSNLEELRENFDLEKAVGYFLSGKLTEWLEDRYYEDEAEALDAIDKDASDLRERLCAALGVPYEGGSELDVEALERLNDKKAVLRQKTGDESIIANADKTALTQEDLADLLDMDEPVIYLCGESFNIPARVKNKKYVGILGTPKISVKANSQEELDAKGIVFENVELPWKQKEAPREETTACPQCGASNAAGAKFCNSCGARMDGTVAAPVQAIPVAASNDAQKKEQQKMMNELFAGTIGKWAPKWAFAHYGSSSQSDISASKKPLCTKLLCRDQYTPEDIVQICMESDLSVGYALTYDSFCVGGKAGNFMAKYVDIKSITGESDPLTISTNDTSFTLNGSKLNSNILYHGRDLKTFLENAIRIAKLFEETTPQESAPKETAEEQTSCVDSDKEWRVPKAQLKAMFASTFKKYFENHGIDANATFSMIEDQSGTNDLTDLQKNTALSLLCGGQYTEDDLVHLCVSHDMTQGWAFTRDSFCFSVSNVSNLGGIIPYESLSRKLSVSGEDVAQMEGRIPPYLEDLTWGGSDERKSVQVLDNLGILLPDLSAFVQWFEWTNAEEDYYLKTFLFNLKNMFRKR